MSARWVGIQQMAHLPGVDPDQCRHNVTHDAGLSSCSRTIFPRYLHRPFALGKSDSPLLRLEHIKVSVIVDVAKKEDDGVSDVASINAKACAVATEVQRSLLSTITARKEDVGRVMDEFEDEWCSYVPRHTK
jgi:hypothetical protein